MPANVSSNYVSSVNRPVTAPQAGVIHFIVANIEGPNQQSDTNRCLGVNYIKNGPLVDDGVPYSAIGYSELVHVEP